MSDKLTASATVSIKAPIEKVWDALTKPELVKQWLFGTDMKTTWEVGSEITYSGEWDGKAYTDKGTVLAVEPNKSIQTSYWSAAWGKDDKPENYVNVSYDLEQQGDETKVTITQDTDEVAKDQSTQNWTTVLESMKKMLEAGE